MRVVPPFLAITLLRLDIAHLSAPIRVRSFRSASLNILMQEATIQGERAMQMMHDCETCSVFPL